MPARTSQNERVVELHERGLNPGEIAERLGLSPKNVRSHLARHEYHNDRPVPTWFTVDRVKERRTVSFLLQRGLLFRVISHKRQGRINPRYGQLREQGWKLIGVYYPDVPRQYVTADIKEAIAEVSRNGHALVPANPGAPLRVTSI